MLPGSHKTKNVYHPETLSKEAGSRPIAGGVIKVELASEDAARKAYLPLAPGDMSIHEEWIVHGSEGNKAADRSRDTLIFAYRPREMVAFERQEGFSHSYNDREADLVRATGYSPHTNSTLFLLSDTYLINPLLYLACQIKVREHIWP